MISASKAYKLTKFNEDISEILKTAEEKINGSIKEGRYECSMQIKANLPDTIREHIKKELTDLGYEVKIPPYSKEPSNVPCDQARYYDYVTISWCYGRDKDR